MLTSWLRIGKGYQGPACEGVVSDRWCAVLGGYRGYSIVSVVPQDFRLTGLASNHIIAHSHISSTNRWTDVRY